MKRQKNLNFAYIFRCIISFVIFVVLTNVSQFLFFDNLFDATIITKKTLNIIYFVIMLLIFESVIYCMNVHDVANRTQYCEAKAKKYRISDGLKSILTSPGFYVEFACVAFLSLVFPTVIVYRCINTAFFGGEGAFVSKLLVLPCLLFMDIIAHLDVRRKWHRCREKEKKQTEVRQTMRSLVKIACVYCGGSVIVPWGVPYIVTLSRLPGLGAILITVFVILMVIATTIFGSLVIRACLKRRKFLQDVKNLARDKNFKISEIKSPYKSLFFEHDGASFTITTEKQTYQCKLIGSILRDAPIVFSDSGKGVRQATLRILGWEVFHFMTEIDYRMEGEKKLLIVLPMPRKIYTSIMNAPPRPADNGDVAGQYAIHSATSFLNSIDRNIL